MVNFLRKRDYKLRNRKWGAPDFSLIELEGISFIGKTHTKACLHHLFSVNEILALQIASIHNSAFYF
ncbi:MAG: queuine tRNA-ribosyltransferase family protein [Bacteroidales bacterium OttesenSCG-928-I14]|nr:queuine tRNA-ribosyltransferase family protein [Bacteroidales bacterium OttesenSCG-928-I14]